jgi:hypothetical protein
MKSAAHVVRMMLEGGYDSMDYSPEDLARYQQLKAEQEQLRDANQIMDPAKGDLSDAWLRNWHEFEQLRNRYNGMPPKQLQGGV